MWHVATPTLFREKVESNRDGFFYGGQRISKWHRVCNERIREIIKVDGELDIAEYVERKQLKC